MRLRRGLPLENTPDVVLVRLSSFCVRSRVCVFERTEKGKIAKNGYFAWDEIFLWNEADLRRAFRA
jgi:hypothetical protein